MSSIGSWWLARQEAQAGETIVWSCMANYSQNAQRATGGKLFLTNQRVLFNPHLIDATQCGITLSLPLTEIAGVDRQPRGGDTFGGGLRDRLRVTLRNGEVYLFVVNGLDAVIARLRTAAAL